MKNLNANGEQAIVSNNGQGNISVVNEDMQEKLFNLILNNVANADGILCGSQVIIDSFVKQIQKTDPSYTEEEIKEAIDKLYYRDYYEMLYEDFLICLAYKNANADDYSNKVEFINGRKHYSYEDFHKLAYKYIYYYIAKQEGIIEDKKGNISRLTYEAYTSAATIIAMAVEEDLPDIAKKIYDAMITCIDKDLASRFIKQMLEDINVTYENRLYKYFRDEKGNTYGEGITYLPCCANSYNCYIYTEINIFYNFNPKTIKEIDKTIQNLNICKRTITLQDILAKLKYQYYQKNLEGYTFGMFYADISENRIVKTQTMPDRFIVFTHDFNPLKQLKEKNDSLHV